MMLSANDSSSVHISSASPLDVDESVVDEGYASSMTSSYTTSIASIHQCVIEENGRTYAAYGLHKSWLPVDDVEVSRFRIQKVCH
jgi:hypothetical protein